MAIECLVLGAGQEVGKSCVVVSMGGKKIMFDCGMHMGYDDHRCYPDFSRISPSNDFTANLTCIVITHFHLDHIGALPYFTEVCGYRGPIYMTLWPRKIYSLEFPRLKQYNILYPTKALAPMMLEDYRKLLVDRRGEKQVFSANDITECMKKVIAVDLKQTVQVDKNLQIRAYYAGHVLGAAMFYAKVGDDAIVYTGDYNMTPDRHLGAAQIDRLQLDLLITESTYATTIRDSRYAREREFLKAVHKCISGGGKVLIPAFALGRAQELCMLLDDYWERMNLSVPIYFSAGLTIQANMYYKMLTGWTSQKVKDTLVTRSSFDFKHVQTFDRSLLNASGPCILFATPGMINGGFSLEVFKQWAPSEKNLITLPGYSVAGTIGHKLMSGKPSRVAVDKDTYVDVRCQIHQLSFSPHTDGKGIMDLVRFLSPRHVVLVHGEKPKMAKLKGQIELEMEIPCHYPANNETVHIPTAHAIKIDATKTFIRKSMNVIHRCYNDSMNSHLPSSSSESLPLLQIRGKRLAEGVLVMEKGKKAKVVHQDELLQALGEEEHKVQFAYCCPVCMSSSGEMQSHEAICRVEQSIVGDSDLNPSSNMSIEVAEITPTGSASVEQIYWLHQLFLKLKNEHGIDNIQEFTDRLQLESFLVRVCSNDDCPYRSEAAHEGKSWMFFCCSWSQIDQKLACRMLSLMKCLSL